MFYAAKKENGFMEFRQEPTDGFFEVVHTGEKPNISSLVWQESIQKFVEDSGLMAEQNAIKAKQDAVLSRIKAQEFGSKFLAEVIELNKSKYIAGVFTVQTLDDMDEDLVLQKIERSAWRGNIPTLKGLILANSAHLETWYTSTEQEDMILKINTWLGV
jgi:hypothetical protein